MNIIVVEGTDGSGKQTQTQMLAEKIRSIGKTVVTQSFPNYESASSGPVKMYLGGELSSDANGVDAYQSSTLFAVDRFCTLKQLENILPTDAFVIFDRYVSSNMIHQASKITNEADTLQYLNWLDNFEFNLMKLPRPNLILFLDMPPEKSIELAHSRKELKTGGKQDIHEKDNNHLINAYKTGKYVSGLFKWNEISCLDNKKQIKPREQISEEIYSIVKKHFSNEL